MPFEEDQPSNLESPRRKDATLKALDARIQRKARSAQFVSGGKRPKYLDLIAKRKTLADDDAVGIPTTNPLSAESGNSRDRARIHVASFQMQYRFGPVNYNSGSIGPLRDATRYFIYVDDPSCEGGARRYSATEKKHDLIAKEGRIRLGEISTPAFSYEKRRRMTSFERLAGALFEAALKESSNHRVTRDALVLIAEKLDSSEFVFDLKYLEKRHRAIVAAHNQKFSRFAIKSWRKLVDTPMLQGGLRRLLAHAAEKVRSPLSA
jgi:hypothetical protein